MSESIRRKAGIDPAGFIPANVNTERQSEEETAPCLPPEQPDKSHSLLYSSFNEGYNGVSRLERLLADHFGRIDCKSFILPLT